MKERKAQKLPPSVTGPASLRKWAKTMEKRQGLDPIARTTDTWREATKDEQQWREAMIRLLEIMVNLTWSPDRLKRFVDWLAENQNSDNLPWDNLV